MVRITLLFLLSFFSGLLHAQAVAKLDRNVIQENETVNLTISLDDSKWFGNPDVSVLDNDFFISHPQKSSQSQWINGKSSALTQWRYTLSPKHAGIITIPAIEIGSSKTQALSLHVKTVQNPSGTASDPLFLEVSVDKQQALVQEQILLTLRINHAIQISNLELGQLEIANARSIESQNSRYDRTINGQNYTTHEIVYAIFPQQSGELVIPSVQVNALIPRTQMDLMMRQGQSRRLISESLTLNIQAGTASQRLPAKQLLIQENWSADPGRLKVGDSITRTITVKAVGLLAEQLPEIPTSDIADVRIYQEKPTFDNQHDSLGNTGTRVDSLAIVATKEGIIDLPAIEIIWWNTQTQQQEIAALPAIKLSVASNGQAIPVAEPKAVVSEPIDQPSSLAPQIVVQQVSIWPWQLATLVSSLLALLFVSLWWAKKPQPVVDAKPQDESVSNSLNRLQAACKDKDLAAMRQALLQWARVQFNNPRIYSFADIKRQKNDPALNHWLDQLEAALYQGGDDKLAWMDLYRAAKAIKSDNEEGLYPTR